MYAIRSYYVSDLEKGSAIILIDAMGMKIAVNQTKEDIEKNKADVITSYSIHYTKLYEKKFRPWDLRRITVFIL